MRGFAGGGGGAGGGPMAAGDGTFGGVSASSGKGGGAIPSSGTAGGGTSGRSTAGRTGTGTNATGASDLTPTQLRAVLRELTADDFTKPVVGRMNINTVSAAVLKDALKLDPRIADAIIARRKAKAEGITSIEDLAGVSGISPQVLQQLAMQFDVTSSVYTVSTRGRAATTGAEVEIEAVVDMSELPVKIISYREQ